MIRGVLGRIGPKAWRVIALAVVVIAVWSFAYSQGWTEGLTVEVIQAWVASLGWWGVVGFLLGACIANLLYLPGMLFVIAAIVLYGDIAGAAVGWAGASLSATTTFLVMRAIGGQPMGEIRNRYAQRLLEGMERRPMWTIALMRTFMQNSPILNTVLALTPVTTRGYVAGTALGMTIPVAAAAVFTGWFV
ncbi:MAG: TVP38/TMEM64 family protein [Myxococcota bacterium]